MMKSYFVTAIGILMLLTSMGIFGYLSKAHLEHGISLGDVGAEVALLDEKIKIQKENIDAARKTLNQLDSQVSAALDRSTTDAGADRSASIRRSQSRERTRAIEDIASAQREISKLNEERAPKATNLRKVEAEVGPIKYIAALIYEESASQDSLEKAVRWVIILIVFVFDPLAVLMFIAVNQSIRPREPPLEPAPTPIVEEPPEEIKEIEPEPEVEEPKVEPVVHLYVDEPQHIKMSGNVQVTDECKIERIVT
jgi:hypothetical protein